MSGTRSFPSFIMLACIYALALGLWLWLSFTFSFAGQNGALTREQASFLVQGGILMVLGFLWFYQSSSVPLTANISIILATFVAVTLLYLAEIALFRSYFSRSALVLFAACFLGGLILYSQLSLRFAQTRVLLLNCPNVRRLVTSRTYQFVPRDAIAPSQIKDVDLIVVDFDVPLDEDDVALVNQAILQDTLVMRSFAFAERITGRTKYANAKHIFNVAPTQKSLYIQIKPFWELALIVATAPIWLPLVALAWLAVRLDSPGPGFFIQQRIGKAGKPYRAIKLRTMTHNAKAQDPGTFARAQDPRVTRVGKLLRRTRIDEVPQFFNVIVGDMSLVGPRPEQVPLAQQFEVSIPFYALRHSVKPGISGWAQTNHGYAGTEDETRIKLEYDLYYVRNVSLQLDAFIVLRTFVTILTGFGSR